MNGVIRADMFRMGYGETKEDTEQYTLCLMKYGIEKYLKWTPEEIIENMTVELACKLHWDLFIQRRYIQDRGFFHFYTVNNLSRSA